MNSLNHRISRRGGTRFSPMYRDLSIMYEGNSEEIPIRIPDLSVSGMFINTPLHFPEGAVLQVRFCLAHSGLEVSTRSEVRYCIPGVGVGVQFLELPAEAREAIEGELAELESR